MREHDSHSSQIRKHNYVMWIFMAFIAYLLITEHWAHIVPYLPWLILLACPFMHTFMHGGHSHGHGSENGKHHDHNSHENHSHQKEE